MNQHLDKIDNDIAQKHLLKHPFYLAAVHAKCENQPTRKQLLSNLIDEEAGSPSHPELWLKFAEGLHVSDLDVRSTEKQPETKNLIDTFRSVCRDRPTAEGLAALYAYESQIPAICESKIDGLRKHYGFNNPEHYRYFSVHVEADREHSAAERKMLSSYIDNHNLESVKASVNRVLDALWEMLSGVCRRHAIA